MNGVVEQKDKVVKVVPASNKYERQDIETAVNEAYDDGYIVEKLIRTADYIFIYFKIPPIE